ncbi:hypothetical protein M407DRAFT_8909 [Tulasnella calospora MUT 4182]|uniref:Uncharacterized protein n=1 Tax=Tulasnella calospora MUT 4182 TaxID=1051891 RepID=A0A0C3LSY3_9AGAM|nr:hypothetical protein M407DRAFT_8909 [Tulasnella calospora MUT 4182]
MARLNYTVVQGRLLDPNNQPHCPKLLSPIATFLVDSFYHLTLGTAPGVILESLVRVSAIRYLFPEEAGANGTARLQETAHSSPTALSARVASHSFEPVVRDCTAAPPVVANLQGVKYESPQKTNIHRSRMEEQWCTFYMYAEFSIEVFLHGTNIEYGVVTRVEDRQGSRSTPWAFLWERDLAKNTIKPTGITSGWSAIVSGLEEFKFSSTGVVS